jgi:Tfp pilus assembly protein PilN
VRSINLIPAEQRRGAGGLAGRAGGASYVVVGALAVFVLMAVFYAIAIGQVSSRQSKLTQVSAQTANTQAQASVLEPYIQFQTIRQQRQAAITSLAASRFDWSDAMDQIARSLPTDVTLSSVAGTAAPANAAPTVATPGVPATAGFGPSVALTGCATSHSEVATVLVDLNKVDGVSTVSLASSAKSAPAAGGSSPATSVTGCHGATFNATLTYAAGAGLVSPIHTSGAATATATSPTTGSTR